MGVLEIFDVCPGDVWCESWGYWMGDFVIFDGCPWDIWWFSL